MSKQFTSKLLGLTAIVVAIEIIGLKLALLDRLDGKIFTTIKAIELPTTFILQIAGFVAIVLILHALAIAYAWLGARSILATCKVRVVTAENIGVIILTLVWTAIFLLNNAFIPGSLFSYWGKFSIGPLDQLDIAILALITALSPTLLISWWMLTTMGKRAIIGLTATASACALVMGLLIEPTQVSASNHKPNIIVIGIDSLRPEYLNSEELMPNLSNLLAESAVFPEVYTPLARTFPSWASMLSGLHPMENGARTNLIDPNLVRREMMMTWQLRVAGYHTVLATDERRFSNIDESYGFDTVIGPQAGAADFVLGRMADLPFVNLLASTEFGGLLFPHLYNNRAVDRLYRPAQFVEHLGEELAHGYPEPLFLATHLCLPHWPYFWADSRAMDEEGQISSVMQSSLSGGLTNLDQDSPEFRNTLVYESALSEVDRQIAILLESLRVSGHLDNAIVVILSDHGEGIGWPEESLAALEDPTLPYGSKQIMGHGNNVFALVQNHAFMAFKRYGEAQYTAGYRPQRFFNYDLKPTLLDLINLPSSNAVSGISMAAWIIDPVLDELDRPLFLETGFNVPASNSLNINPDEVLSQGGHFYALTDDAKLEISPAKMDELIKNKQRGVLRGSRLLAQVPNKSKAGNIQYDWVLADTNGKGAVKLVAKNYTSECQSQCTAMLTELVDFYGAELAIEQWPAYPAYLQAVRLADNTMNTN